MGDFENIPDVLSNCQEIVDESAFNWPIAYEQNAISRHFLPNTTSSTLTAITDVPEARPPTPLMDWDRELSAFFSRPPSEADTPIRGSEDTEETGISDASYSPVTVKAERISVESKGKTNLGEAESVALSLESSANSTACTSSLELARSRVQPWVIWRVDGQLFSVKRAPKKQRGKIHKVWGVKSTQDLALFFGIRIRSMQRLTAGTGVLCPLIVMKADISGQKHRPIWMMKAYDPKLYGGGIEQVAHSYGSQTPDAGFLVHAKKKGGRKRGCITPGYLVADERVIY